MLLFCALACTDARASQAIWSRLDGVRYVESEHNDGDSFRVWHSGREYVFRLYGVDAPETSMDFPERVASQASEFGLSESEAVSGGQAAADVVKSLLRNGAFSVLTSGEDALGRTRGGRIYAYAILPGNRDLGAELLSRGLARAHGRTPSAPYPLYQEIKREYEKLEQSAKSLRRGLWKASSTHSKNNGSNRALPWTKAGDDSSRSAKKININKATLSELESLPGIGPVLAARIAASRPYAGEADLLKVEGVGPARAASMRPMVEY
jgi:endonuclease YncB( thermonuclease family)